MIMMPQCSLTLAVDAKDKVVLFKPVYFDHLMVSAVHAK